MMIHTRAEDKNANEPGKLISEVPMVKLKFKVLVQLHPGDNEIVFDFLGVKDTLRISFNQVSFPFTVRYCQEAYKDTLTENDAGLENDFYIKWRSILIGIWL